MSGSVTLATVVWKFNGIIAYEKHAYIFPLQIYHNICF